MEKEKQTNRVSLAERKEILDKIHDAFILGKYPNSGNDQIMQNLHRLIADVEEMILLKEKEKVNLAKERKV